MYSKTSTNYRKANRRVSPAVRMVIFVLIVLAAIVSVIIYKVNGVEAPTTESTTNVTTQQTQNTTEIVRPVTTETQTTETIKINSTTQILEEEVTTDTTTTEIETEEEEVPQPYVGEYELPLTGATVYVTSDMTLNDMSGTAIEALNAGDALCIISQEGNKLFCESKTGTRGYIDESACMVNLPDLVPSIVYTCTNSSSSIYRSSGKDLDGVTGMQLYNVEQYNERLGKVEFNMPILFQTAKKVMEAQKLALAEGYSLRIFETYRPMDTQMKVRDSLKALAASDSDVRRGIVGHGWSENWFIAQGISNHQRGYAMDVALVKVNQTEVVTCGNYAYVDVVSWDEVEMPTEMHELSDAAVSLVSGVNSGSATAWKSVATASTMTEGALKLREFCTGAGFTPLASEWWHFNDLTAKESNAGSRSNGNYFLAANLSVIPE